MTLLSDNDKSRIEKRFESDKDSVCKKDMILKYAVYLTCMEKIQAITPDLKDYGMSFV